MDGDWETVKQKKVPKKKVVEQEHKPQFGGKGKKGKLIAGPVQQIGQNNNYLSNNQDYSSMNNQASNIADFDYHIDSDEEEQKFETYTKVCSNAVQDARAKAKLSQG